MEDNSELHERLKKLDELKVFIEKLDEKLISVSSILNLEFSKIIKEVRRRKLKFQLLFQNLRFP